MNLANLKKDDVVLLVTREYVTTSYRKAHVEKLTKTRVKVRIRRSENDHYYLEFNLKDGKQYPAQRGYGYHTHIEVMTEENKEVWDTYVQRKTAENEIYELSESMRGLTRDLDKLTLVQLRSMRTHMRALADLVKEIKT